MNACQVRDKGKRVRQFGRNEMYGRGSGTPSQTSSGKLDAKCIA